MNILITGVAGFIGFHLAKALLSLGNTVIGVDNLNDYYDVSLKKRRLVEIEEAINKGKFIFYKGSLEDDKFLRNIFSQNSIDTVVNLAAQAGVRYSIENPLAYVNSNIVGFTNLIDISAKAKISNFIYASTSSVYGANSSIPFSVDDSANHPLQFYAATKKANELMAHSYSNIYKLPTTGLRFFTVYGPWGRPDMALFKFTENIINDMPIELYNYGNHCRDFTYIDDIVDGIIRCCFNPAGIDENWNSKVPNPSTSFCPWRVLNLGSGAKVHLKDYVSEIEKAVGKKAKIKLMPMQAGDVLETSCCYLKTTQEIGYSSNTPIEIGIPNFVKWYRSYYKV